MSGGVLLAPSGDGRLQLTHVLAADSVGRVVDDLTGAGFIEVDQKRGRIYAIRLTKKGTAAARKTLAGNVGSEIDFDQETFDSGLARFVISSMGARMSCYVEQLDGSETTRHASPSTGA